MQSTNFKVLFIYPNTMMSTLIPIHITQLSGVLKTQGIETRVFDTTYYKTEEKSSEEIRIELLQLKPFDMSKSGVTYIESDIYKDLRQLIESFRPNLIAITFVEDTVDLGMRLIASIRDIDCPVIAGGIYVTLHPEKIINLPNIDMICLGEGEGPLLEVCKAMINGDEYRDINNIWVKNGDKILRNDIRHPIDLDLLPYMDFNIWEKRRLVRPMQGKNFLMLHVEFERGCPYHCSYCCSPGMSKLYSSNSFNNYYRRKSNKRIVDEIVFYRNLFPEANFINFNAECFLARPVENLAELALEYKKTVNLPFWCQSRVETVSEEKIRILKEMGCSNMNFGIEHGNEEFRRKMLKRNVSNNTIVTALKIIEKYEIAYTVNNIIGFPEETRDLVFDTIRLNRQLNPNTINCFMAVPYKGSELYYYSLERGYINSDEKTHQLIGGGNIKNVNFTIDELKGLQRAFPLYCRFGEERFEEIRLAEKFDDIGNKTFKRLSKEYQEKYM